MLTALFLLLACCSTAKSTTTVDYELEGTFWTWSAPPSLAPENNRASYTGRLTFELPDPCIDIGNATTISAPNIAMYLRVDSTLDDSNKIVREFNFDGPLTASFNPPYTKPASGYLNPAFIQIWVEGGSHGTNASFSLENYQGPETTNWKYEMPINNLYEALTNLHAFYVGDLGLDTDDFEPEYFGSTDTSGYIKEPTFSGDHSCPNPVDDSAIPMAAFALALALPLVLHRRFVNKNS